MFRRTWLAAIAVATAFTVTALFPTLSFADNATCMQCHQNAQNGGLMPAQNFDVAAVDYSTACPKCHLNFAGSHPYHNTNSNCGAMCHGGWGASLSANVPVYTAALGGGKSGGFASADSTATSPALLHIIHSRSRWMGDKATSGSSCKSCHAVAACDACHDSPLEPTHESHASTDNPTSVANTSRGVMGGNQASTDGYTPADVSTCGDPACHNTAGVAVGAPGLKDDKVHIASPANDYLANPTVVKSPSTAWLTVKASAYTMGQISSSNTASATLSVPFTGTQIALIADKDPFRGIAEILIDGVSKGTVDLYQSTTVNQVVVWRSAPLASADHTITVKVTGTKRSIARAAYVRVDQFKIYTKLPGTVAPTCESCHGDVVSLHGDVHEGNPDYSAYVRGEVSYNAPADGQRHTSGRTLKCVTCHRSSNLVTVHLGENSCLLCHGTGGPRSSFAAWDKTCMQGGCHTPTEYANGVPMIQHDDAAAYAIHNVVAVEPVRDGGPRGGCVTECHSVGCMASCHTVKDGTSDYSAPVTRVSKISTDPVTWKLYPVDSQSGVAQTFYSFDGAPFALYGTTQAASGIRGPLDALRVGAHALRYYSVDASGNVEATKTTNYVTTGVDLTPPMITTTGIRSGNSVVATSFALSVKDPQNPVPSSGAASLHVEYKSYVREWEYYAIPTPIWRPVDFTVPTSSWDTSATFARLEDQAWAGFGGGTVSNKGGLNGSPGYLFVVRYSAKDYAGNSSVVAEDSVYIDNAAPTTSIATVTAGEYRWKLSPYDFPAGVDSTYYSFDGGPFAPCTAADLANGIVNTQPGGTSLGAHTLRYYAVDILGHVATTKTHNYRVIETTPPLSLLSATMTSSSVTIDVWDPVGSVAPSGVKNVVGFVKQGVVTKSINTTFALGDPAATRSIEVTVSADGPWDLQYYVYDWDGNWSWYNKSFYRDTTPPSSGLGGGWNTQWQLGAGDGFGSGVASVYYRFDSMPATQVLNPTGFVYFNTPDGVKATYGAHTLWYWAVDRFGFAETPKSTTFSVPDTTKPTITLTRSSTGASSKTAYLQAQDAVTAPSGVKQIWYRVDYAAWVTVPFDTTSNPSATVQTEILGMPNGLRTIDYYVVDVANNASVTKTEYISIDSNAPS